jgi:hypothetical protein
MQSPCCHRHLHQHSILIHELGLTLLQKKDEDKRVGNFLRDMLMANLIDPDNYINGTWTDAVETEDADPSAQDNTSTQDDATNTNLSLLLSDSPVHKPALVTKEALRRPFEDNSDVLAMYCFRITSGHLSCAVCTASLLRSSCYALHHAQYLLQMVSVPLDAFTCYVRRYNPIRAYLRFTCLVCTAHSLFVIVSSCTASACTSCI